LGTLQGSEKPSRRRLSRQPPGAALAVGQFAQPQRGHRPAAGLIHAKSFGVADRKDGRAATPETLSRIGPITKVFTTTLLALLRDWGSVRLDDPVADYLPPEVKLPGDPRGSPAITLRHLAAHSLGLPSLPPNLVAKGEDPYAGNSATKRNTLRKAFLESSPGLRAQGIAVQRK
jgi:CubicO group peptidase (beta-lactamase class C family)